MIPERFARLKAVLDRRQPDLTVVMDRVNKPHNFSAILRNCDAAGAMEAHAVRPDSGLDVHRHTSAGSTKWVRVHRYGEVAEALGAVKAQGFKIVAAHPSVDAVPYRQIDFTVPTAVLAGAELYGVSDEGLALADECAMIPMMGMVQSLNVSVAVAIMLMEAVDQRDSAGLYDRCRLSPRTYERILFEWAYPRIAARCRRRKESYPELNEEGEIVGDVSR
jgi:tRNA (guanosine-2'-O-)-methyltransferase